MSLQDYAALTVVTGVAVGLLLRGWRVLRRGSAHCGGCLGCVPRKTTRRLIEISAPRDVSGTEG